MRFTAKEGHCAASRAGLHGLSGARPGDSLKRFHDGDIGDATTFTHGL